VVTRWEPLSVDALQIEIGPRLTGSTDSSATDRDVEIAPAAETAGLGDERRVPIHTPRLELPAPAPTNTVCYRYRPAGWPDGEALDDLNRRMQ
jgi:hypothetical protein